MQYTQSINRRTFIYGGFLASRLMGQDLNEPPVEYVCPMDKDVRSPYPGTCPRCGMKLVAGVPEAEEHRLELSLSPRTPRPGQKVQLAFTVRAPKTDKPVTDFQVIHEKLYHLFIVSQDLQFFVHDHPVKGPDGVFRYNTVFPRPGMYRLLSDFYPQAASPQLIASTVIVPGAAITPGSVLQADTTPKSAGGMEVSLTTEPAQPLAGMKTLLFFHLDPADGVERYLGAWGHMLAASGDLVDLIHTHPFIADGGPEVQFNLIFPREGVYRIWVQFQRKGVVGTAAFNVPVTTL